MKNLFILCGKPGCGKSTLAKFITEQYGTVHFSADDFMLKFYGQIEDRDEFDKKLSTCKEMIYSICDQLLDKNNVILDFGFWTKKERDFIKKKFEKYNIILIYIKLNDEEIFKRINHRNQNLQNNEYFMDRATFDILSSKFQEPQDEEETLIFTTKADLIKKIVLI